MDLNKLQTKKYTQLHQVKVANELLTVKETDEYRWFEHNGDGVQSLMSLKSPNHLVLPIPQSMLLFLLWKKTPLRVLNLGLGGASFERALSVFNNIDITSIEQSRVIIDMARQYFKIPEKTSIKCQKAEDYIATTHAKFDVVLCDMFIDEKSPEYLFDAEFYNKLKAITLDQPVVILNLFAETEIQLLNALFAIKKSFPFIALIDFDHYKNVVVVCSTSEIPSRDDLRNNLALLNRIDLTGLEAIIPRIRYIPS